MPASPRSRASFISVTTVEDQSATPQQIAKLDDTLKGWGGKFQSEMYQALHGWTVPGSRRPYNEKQSERHFEKLFDLVEAAPSAMSLPQ